LPTRLATRPEGGATCSVDATLADEAPCATHLGMLDPLDADGVRRPRAGVDGGPGGRICEIHELSGAEADECSTVAEPAGVSAGWCATTTLAPHGCSTGFRFVQGAVPRGGAEIHFTCDEAR
jgi:hypothetical protein